MAPSPTRYLVYADTDDGVLKIHGPLGPAQAEGFRAGAEWVNDSAIAYLFSADSYGAALSLYHDDAAYPQLYPEYEIEKVKFVAPGLEDAVSDQFLLFFDEDYGTLKIRGPLTFAQAQGFIAAAEWVNDSSLTYQDAYPSLKAAKSGAREFNQSADESYEIETFVVDIDPEVTPSPEV